MKDNCTTIEDFLSDESFVLWATGNKDNDESGWSNWLSENPSKAVIANEAMNILKLIQIKNFSVNKDQIDAAEIRLRDAIKMESAPARVIHINRRRIWYWSAAAVIVFSIALGFFSFFNKSEKLELATRYGEIKKNNLPDGTQVVLNANSTLTFGDKWKEGKDREVWIKGEAFFYVKKTPEHNKFIVHTDAFDIEVTGTSFNVINENGNSSIILKEGSVKIHRAGEKEILMQPGDLVEYGNHRIEKKEVSKQDYMAWTENKLVFNNTPISEVANIIKKHYGIEVKLAEDDMAQKTITGIMPNDNLDVLLQSLNATQEFKVLKNGDSILITGFK
jgi:ferric-dicitrate binding protein FerR (iron transport regulator)